MNIFRSLKNLKISSKLLVGYTLLFFLIISGTLYFSYLSIKESLEKQIHSQLTASTTNLSNLFRTTAANSIENFLRAKAETNHKLIEELHEEFLFGRMSEESAKKRAATFLKSQVIGKTGYFYIADSKGNVLVHPQKEFEGKNLLEFEVVKQQIEKKTGFLEYLWKNPGDSVARSKVLYMEYFEPWDWIISVSGYKNEFNTIINAEEFRKQILSIKFGESGYSFLINTSGEVLVHPIFPKGNYSDLKDADGKFFFKQMTEQKSGIIYYNWLDPGAIKARKKIVLFSYIPEFEWIIATSGYLDEFYQPLVHLQNIFVISLLLTVFIIVPLTYWLSNTITKPLNKLTKLLSGLSKGDFSSELLVESKDEVGQLSFYYNQFIKKMSEYDYSLQAAAHDWMEAEKKIARSEKRLRNILTTMGEGYVEVDNSSAIVDVNPAFCKLISLEREQIIGNYLTTFLDFEASEIVKAQLKKLEQESFSSYVINFSIPGNDEKIHVLIHSTRIVNATGENAGVFSLVTDITQHVKREEEIKKLNIHLSNKSTELSQIIQVTSQDLKTALINIQGFNTELSESVNELVKYITGNFDQQKFPKNIDTLVNSEIPEYSNILNLNILKIDSMLSGLLRLTLLGKDPIQRIKLNLNELIQNVLSPFRLEIESSEITILVENLPGIFGDEKLISFMFHNLIDNAIKYHSPARKSEIVIKGNVADDSIILSVSDNGIGIEDFNKKKIFEIFHRLDPDLSTGAGLGLTMVNKIAGLHFGKVWVESVYGEGSTFFISIPKNLR